MSDGSLARFAVKAGLEVHWHDITGRQHTVAPDVLRHVLTALGYAVTTEQQIADSEVWLDSQTRLPAGFLTAWAGETFTAGSHQFQAPWEPGYHEIEVDGDLITLVVAPRRCFGIPDLTDARLAGLAVQLYSLRGGNSAGFGGFAALAEFCASAATHGIHAVACSPVHALFRSNPEHFGPYSPSSRLFLNPIYADPAVCGANIKCGGDDAPLIDWPAVAESKFALLRNAYADFDPYEYPAFVKFCQDGGERLQRHAVFEALDGHFRKQNFRTWRDWPVQYRDPESVEVLRFAAIHQDEIAFGIFLQFVTAISAARAQEQARLSGMKIGIIADLATGVDPAGSDCWAAPDDVLNGLCIGAPPDLFNAAGQNWGITALSPVRLRKKRFEAFTALVRANMARAGGVRIDHAMGLMRLWVIPEGAGAEEGVYLRYPFDDLLRLISFESHRSRTIVIGEDLGTVPHGFSDTLSHRGVLGMEVLWFQLQNQYDFIPAANWQRESVAMTTTHDLPTIAGWWTGRDIEWRTKIGLRTIKGSEAEDREDRRRMKENLWSALVSGHCVERGPQPSAPDEVVDGAIGFVGRTPSRLAIVPAEDLCGIEEQPNFPGTTTQHPNWRRRLPPGDFFSRPDVADRVGRLIRSRRF